MVHPGSKKIVVGGLKLRCRYFTDAADAARGGDRKQPQVIGNSRVYVDLVNHAVRPQDSALPGLLIGEEIDARLGEAVPHGLIADEKERIVFPNRARNG